MHIAYVTETYPPEINGVALTVARTVDYLRGRGHEVELIRPAQPGELRGDAPGQWRCHGWPIPMYSEMRFGVSRPTTLMRRFVAMRSSLVHVATEGPLGWAAVAAANRLGVAVTSDFRTNFHQYSRFYGAGCLEPLIRGYLRRFHNQTRRSFVPTAQTCRDLLRDGFERVEVVGRGVDLDRFSPDHRSHDLRRSWGDGDGPVLLHVGRLAAEKDVELALKAYTHTRGFVPSARMVVVGEGPLRKRLEAQHPEVRFVGRQTGDALAAHYASADLFLFPSQSETFGNVTLEALASGLPVVAFDMAAAAEFVRDRVNGRVVAPGDSAAFILATCAQTAMLAAAAPMRAAARASVSSCTWDSVLARFESRLLETVNDTQGLRAAAACAC